MSARRIGIWFVGAWGGVAATAALGLAALRRNLSERHGLVTALPEFQGLDLDEPGCFIVGGHDIRRASYLSAVLDLHRKSGVFDRDLIEVCKDDLESWDANVRPGTILGSGATIGRMADWPEVESVDSPRKIVDRIRKDLEDFRSRHSLDQCVVVNVSSTEPPGPLGESFATVRKFQEALERKDASIPSSSLYAWAAVDLGLPFVNFTPSLGASFPAAYELARERKTPLAGQDGKTGETMMKTVLAPMFAHRNLRVLSWVGHNIFGNRDGLVLNDPANKAAKVQTKDQVLTEVLGYKPQTLVTIEYIESMDDWKTAWDHIHFQGFLGTKMMLQFTWQGCDSLLAAPLVLDISRLTLLAQRRGESGVLKHLACFFKSPMDVAENDFFRQWNMLLEYVAGIR